MNEWKTVVGYEGLYEVNELGQVRSLPRYTTKGRILKIYTNKHNGYQYVCLCKNNKSVTRRLHRVVMEAFFGKRDELQINHINGIKNDNRLVNLEYCTQSENMRHAYDMGLEIPRGRKVRCLDDNRVFNTLTECVVFYGGSKASCLTRVCNGQRKHYKGRRFEYVD